MITSQVLTNQSNPGSGQEPTNIQKKKNFNRRGAGRRSAFILWAGNGPGKPCAQRSVHHSVEGILSARTSGSGTRQQPRPVLGEPE